MAKTFNQLSRELEVETRRNDKRYIGALVITGGFLTGHDTLRHWLPTFHKRIAKGRVIVHNQIAHTKDMPIGLNGFRCWSQKPTSKLVRCKCGWAGIEHYHVKGVGSHKSFTEAEYEKRFGEPVYGPRKEWLQ